jgi:hypothetical protein
VLRFDFALNFLTYCAIVGAMYGVRLYTQARRRELTAAQLEASLAAARLEGLRAQLNPHFLFNTLNAISVLAMKGQHAAVTDTLARLGELLRVSLDDTRPHQVPLSDEVEFLGGYLEILQLRFGDRMVVEQSIDNDVLGALVPARAESPSALGGRRNVSSFRCQTTARDSAPARRGATASDSATPARAWSRSTARRSGWSSSTGRKAGQS